MIDQQLVFLDIETTGLNEVKDQILEIALLPVDPCLVPTDIGFSSVVDVDIESMMESIAPQVRTMHENNGLFEEIRQGQGDSPHAVMAEAIEYLQDLGECKLIMAGNSIHFDRRFLRRQVPRLEDMFYHRMLDVSAFQSLAEHLHRPVPIKKMSHRALDDCRESLQLALYWAERLGA